MLKKQKKEALTEMNKLRWFQQGWLKSPPSKKEAEEADDGPFSEAFRRVHLLHCSFEEDDRLPRHLWSNNLNKDEFKSELEAKVYRKNHEKFLDAYEDTKKIDKEIKKKKAKNEEKKKARKK